MRQAITGAARLVKRPRALTIGGQGPNCVAMRSNSFPTAIKRRIQPNREAFVLVNQRAVEVYGPGAAAKSDDLSIGLFQDSSQGRSLDLAKSDFPILWDDLTG